MTNAVAMVAVGLASWFYPHRTLRDGHYVCASRVWPKGSLVRVTEIRNGCSVVVEIDDFGPAKHIFKKGVLIDLCPEAFAILDGLSLGHAPVKIERLK